MGLKFYLQCVDDTNPANVTSSREEIIYGTISTTMSGPYASAVDIDIKYSKQCDWVKVYIPYEVSTATIATIITIDDALDASLRPTSLQGDQIKVEQDGVIQSGSVTIDISGIIKIGQANMANFSGSGSTGPYGMTLEYPTA